MWSLPQTSPQFETELLLIEAAGFSTIILQGLPTPQQRIKLEEHGFSIIIDTGLRNLHRNNLKRDKELIREIIQTHINEYRSYSSIQGILLFAHGLVFDDDFRLFFEEEVERIHANHSHLDIYLVTNFEIVDIPFATNIRELTNSKLMQEVTFEGKIFVTLDMQSLNLRHFRDQLSGLASASLIWFNGTTLLEQFSVNPSLVSLFYTYNTQKNPIYGVEAPQFVVPLPNWEVPLFFLLMISYLIFFRKVVSYKRTLFRYFYSHLFFVNDVLNRVILLGKMNFFIVPILGLFFAHIFTVSLYYFMGEMGMDTLKYHYSVFDQPNLVFLFAFAIFIVMNLSSILWVSSATWRLGGVSQASVLVIWPQHILIPLSFLSLLISKAGYSAIFSIISVSFAVLLLPLSFFLASKNFSEKPTFGKYIHFSVTLLLGLITLVMSILYIHYRTDITAVIELALIRSELFSIY